MRTAGCGRWRGRGHRAAVEGDHFTAGDPQGLDLGRDVDVVLMRQDPPFDIGYITATYLLERIAGETLVVNDPRSGPRRAREIVRARFRALHAADG
jgi:glutathione synthase